MDDTIVRDIKEALDPLRPRRTPWICRLGFHDGPWGAPIPQWKTSIGKSMYYHQERRCRRCGSISVRKGMW